MNAQAGEGSQAVVLSPAQRLEASRARLRKAWIGEPPVAGETPESHAHEGSAFHRFAELIAAGWERHPLKAQLDAALSVMGPAARSTFGPLVQRHPLRLLAFAVGLGALTIWLRPWRWLPRAALGSALLSVLLPRREIMGWISSGRWLDLLRSENLEAWFGRATAPAATPEDGTASGAATSSREPAGGASAGPAMSEPVASPQEPTSYAGRASAPIPAAGAHP